MKSIRQSLKRTTSGRVSGAARSTQQTRRDLTAALAKGSEQESAKYYSQFEFSRFRKYFYNDYGWYPTLEQAKEVKDAFLRVDTKRQGMIKEDDLEDVLELLKPDTDEPIPVDDIRRELSEANMIDSGTKALLWPVFLRALTFEESQVEDTVMLLKMDVEKEVERDNAFARHYDEVVEKLQTDEIKIKNTRDLKCAFLNHLNLLTEQLEIEALYTYLEDHEFPPEQRKSQRGSISKTLALLLSIFVSDVLDPFRGTSSDGTEEDESSANKEDAKGEGDSEARSVKFKTRRLLTKLRICQEDELPEWKERGYRPIPAVTPLETAENSVPLSSTISKSKKVLSGLESSEGDVVTFEDPDKCLDCASVSLNFGGTGKRIFLLGKMADVKDSAALMHVAISDNEDDNAARNEGYLCVGTSTNAESEFGANRFIWTKEGYDTLISDALLAVVHQDHRKKDGSLEKTFVQLNRLLHRQGYRMSMGDLNAGNGSYGVFLFTLTERRTSDARRGGSIPLSSIYRSVLNRVCENLYDVRTKIFYSMWGTIDRCEEMVIQKLAHARNSRDARLRAAKQLFPTLNNHEIIANSALMLAAQLFTECLFSFGATSSDGKGCHKRQLLEFLSRNDSFDVTWKGQQVSVIPVGSPDAASREFLNQIWSTTFDRVQFICCLLVSSPYGAFEATCHQSIGHSACNRLELEENDEETELDKHFESLGDIALASAVMEAVHALLDEQWDFEFILERSHKLDTRKHADNKDLPTPHLSKCSQVNDDDGREAWMFDYHFSEAASKSMDIIESEKLEDVCSACNSLYSVCNKNTKGKWCTGRELKGLIQLASYLALSSVISSHKGLSGSSSRMRKAGLLILVARRQIGAVESDQDRGKLSKNEMKSTMHALGIGWNDYITNSLQELPEEQLISFNAVASNCQIVRLDQLMLAFCTIFQQSSQIAAMKLCLRSLKSFSGKDFGSVIRKWSKLSKKKNVFSCDEKALKLIISAVISHYKETKAVLSRFRCVDLFCMTLDILCFKVLNGENMSHRESPQKSLSSNELFYWLLDWWIPSRIIPSEQLCHLSKLFLETPDVLEDQTAEDWIDQMDQSSENHKLESTEVPLIELSQYVDDINKYGVRPDRIKRPALDGRCLTSVSSPVLPLGTPHFDASSLVKAIGGSSQIHTMAHLSLQIRRGNKCFVYPASVCISDFLQLARVSSYLLTIFPKKSLVSQFALKSFKFLKPSDFEPPFKIDSSPKKSSRSRSLSETDGDSVQSNGSSTSADQGEESHDSESDVAASETDSTVSTKKGSSPRFDEEQIKRLEFLTDISKSSGDSAAGVTNALHGSDPVVKKLESSTVEEQELRKNKKFHLITGVTIQGQHSPSAIDQHRAVVSLDKSHKLLVRFKTMKKANLLGEDYDQLREAISEVTIDVLNSSDIKKKGHKRLGDALLQKKPRPAYLHVTQSGRQSQTICMKWKLEDYYEEKSKNVIRSLWVLRPLSRLSSGQIKAWCQGEISLSVSETGRTGEHTRSENVCHEGDSDLSLLETMGMREKNVRVPRSIELISEPLRELYEIWYKRGPSISSPIDTLFHGLDQVDGLGWMNLRDFRHVLERELPSFLRRSNFSLPLDHEDLRNIEKWLSDPTMGLVRRTGFSQEVLVDYWLFSRMMMHPPNEYRTLAVASCIRKCFVAKFGCTKKNFTRETMTFFSSIVKGYASRMKVNQLHRTLQRDMNIEISNGTLRDICNCLRVYIDIHDQIDYCILLYRLFGSSGCWIKSSFRQHYSLRRVKKHLRGAARKSHIDLLEIKQLWQNLAGNYETCKFNDFLKAIQNQFPLLHSLESSEVVALKNALDPEGNRSVKFSAFRSLLHLDDYEKEKIRHIMQSYFSTLFAHDPEEAREVIDIFYTDAVVTDIDVRSVHVSPKEFFALVREAGLPLGTTDMLLCAQLFLHNENCVVDCAEFIWWALSKFDIEKVVEQSKSIEENIDHTNESKKPTSEARVVSSAKESISSSLSAVSTTVTSCATTPTTISTAAAETAGKTALAASVHPDIIGTEEMEELERIGNVRSSQSHDTLAGLTAYFRKGAQATSQSAIDKEVERKYQNSYSTQGVWTCSVCSFRNSGWSSSCYMCATPAAIANSGSPPSPRDEAYWIAETGQWFVGEVDEPQKENENKEKPPMKSSKLLNDPTPTGVNAETVQSRLGWNGDPLQRPPGVLR